MKRLVIELLSIEKGKAYGFQEYVFNLLNFLHKNREEIKAKEVIILCKDNSENMFQKYSDKFIIKGYPYSSYAKRFWLEITLPFRLRLTSEDLLFIPGNCSGWFKKSKELLVVHDLLYKRKDWVPSALMRWQRELYLPRSLKKADKIIAISQFTKDDIEYYYPQTKGKIEVIHNSMNFSKFEGADVADLGYDYFLAISTNADYKNQKTVLKAFSRYVELGGDKHLVLIGKQSSTSESGQVYASLPTEVKERIVWKSNISNSELGALYKGASCFISASKFEGLGMPVVEAMSFGLPVLLSDILPHREVSMNQGEYFTPSDVDTLTFKMLNLSFKRRDYAKMIRDMFSEENTSAKYIELINRVGGNFGEEVKNSYPVNNIKKHNMS